MWEAILCARTPSRRYLRGTAPQGRSTTETLIAMYEERFADPRNVENNLADGDTQSIHILYRLYNMTYMYEYVINIYIYYTIMNICIM